MHLRRIGQNHRTKGFLAGTVWQLAAATSSTKKLQGLSPFSTAIRARSLCRNVLRPPCRPTSERANLYPQRTDGERALGLRAMTSATEHRLSVHQTLCFPDYLMRIFVVSQRDEFGVSQMVGTCPL